MNGQHLQLIWICFLLWFFRHNQYLIFYSFDSLERFINMESENIEEEVLNPDFIVVFLLLAALTFLFLYLRERSKNFRFKPKKKDFEQLRNELSDREDEVLQIVLEGKSQKEIAESLHIEISTIKSHLNKIYRLFDVRDKKQLIKRYREQKTTS